MRCFLILLLFFVAKSAFAVPALVVERLNYDFGEIVQGEDTTHTFRFHNAGDQVLDIGGLRSSCGCTAALLTTRRLEPGGMGELQLTFDSRGFRGTVQKMVTFETNDPKHSVVSFSLRGKVKAELYLQPQRINWGVVENNTPLTGEIEVVNESKRTVTLRPPEVTSATISAEWDVLEIAPGERSHIKVSAAFGENKKRLAGYIIINSDFANLPQLKVPVSARLSSK